MFQPKRISVFGVGDAGSVTSACQADLGHQVVGVELAIAAIARNVLPVVDLVQCR